MRKNHDGWRTDILDARDFAVHVSAEYIECVLWQALFNKDIIVGIYSFNL